AAAAQRRPRGSARAAVRRGSKPVKRRRPTMAQRFLEMYFHGVGEEDLTSRPPEALAGAALHHLQLGSGRRAPGQSLVRVFNPDKARDGFESPHTVVMIVTDDMPFLVDSVGIVF